MRLLGTRTSAGQHELQHGGIFPPTDRLVIAAANADLLESHRLIQAYRGGVRRPHFEEGFAHAGCPGPVYQIVEDATADAAAAEVRIDAQIEDVRLTGADAHHPVADDFIR